MDFDGIGWISSSRWIKLSQASKKVSLYLKVITIICEVIDVIYFIPMKVSRNRGQYLTRKFSLSDTYLR